MNSILEFLLLPMEMLEWIVDRVIPLHRDRCDETKVAVRGGNPCDLVADHGEKPYVARAVLRIVIGYALVGLSVTLASSLAETNVEDAKARDLGIAVHRPPGYAGAGICAFLISGFSFAYYGWSCLVFDSECKETLNGTKAQRDEAGDQSPGVITVAKVSTTREPASTGSQTNMPTPSFSATFSALGILLVSLHLTLLPPLVIAFALGRLGFLPSINEKSLVIGYLIVSTVIAFVAACWLFLKADNERHDALVQNELNKRNAASNTSNPELPWENAKFHRK